MNNFPAMTEEQRQELIAECENEIAELTQSIQRCDAIGTADYLMHLQSQFLRQQISLAALTAEPEAWAHRLVNKHNGVGHPWVYGSAEASESEGDMFRIEVMKLFTAPPAPVLREPDGWIKCSERMPEDDTLCLGFDVEGIIWTAHYDCGFLTPDCGADDVVFTHWMPLPAPPEASNEQ